MKEQKYMKGPKATANFENLARAIFKVAKAAIVPDGWPGPPWVPHVSRFSRRGCEQGKGSFALRRRRTDTWNTHVVCCQLRGSPLLEPREKRGTPGFELPRKKTIGLY